MLSIFQLSSIGNGEQHYTAASTNDLGIEGVTLKFEEDEAKRMSIKFKVL